MNNQGIMSINTMVSSQATHVPAFLAKLWRIVDDPSTNNLICWSELGNSFIIHNQARFARDLLPLYYKHNNMASFVRQLNMYGFHKVVSVEQGGLRVEKDEMEFAHPFFLQGNESSLDLIKRKIPASKLEETRGRPENLSNVLIDVRQMKGRQETMDNKLVSMKRENEALWRELSTLRQKHAKQQQIVSKLLQFLVGMMSSQSHRISFKRRMPLMLNDVDGDGKPAKLSRPNNTVANNDESSNGPVIHEVFEGDEPLLILSMPDEARNEQQPTQQNRVVATKEQQRKLVNQARSAGVKVAEAGNTSSAPTNQLTDSTVDANQSTQNSGTMEVFPTVESPVIESAESPYVSDLMSIHSIESTNSPQASPGVRNDGNRDPGISTDMVSRTDDQLSRQQVATKTVVKPEVIVRDDLDLHLDDVQFGLDSLKDLLQGTQYNIDTSTLSGVGSPFNLSNLDSHAVSKLFGPDSHSHLFGLVNENNEKSEDDTALQGNELVGTGSEMVSYNPCLFELAEDDSHFFEDATANGVFLDDELESMLTTDRSALGGGTV